MSHTLLIVDDEVSILSSLQGIFEDEGYGVRTAESAEIAMKIVRKKAAIFSAVFLDIWMPGMDGMQLLEWIIKQHPKLPVIMMSGHGTIETAVKATKKGAYDFVEKPLSLEKVLLVVAHAIKESALEKENEELKQKHWSKSYDIIGESPSIVEIREQIKLVAPSEGWVLIHGENGTGKELVACEVHKQSNRSKRPFIEVNCAAIPEELIESELFGHEKGSFTGAVNKKIGKFDQANGGSLFLDEIGDMSLKTQAKILRILQEQRFERVGGNQVIEVDVRVIAASNKDLQKEIKVGNFREDLYYRLNVIPIEVPPLRERLRDIDILVRYFMDQFTKINHYPAKSISEEALATLRKYQWPGNIRELRNIVERMMIMVPKDTIELEHIPMSIRAQNSNFLQVSQYPNTLREAKECFEKHFLLTTLVKNNWNITKTAEIIQMERSNLHKKIKQLDIAIPKK